MRKLMYAGLLLLLSFALFIVNAHASGGGGGSIGDTDIVWRSVNFIVLAGVLYWLLADKLKGFFSARRAEIKEAHELAELAKQAAQAKHNDYVEKIEKASAEIDKIAEAIKDQGNAEREKIIADAYKIAEKIKEDTKARMEQEFKEASNMLRKEAVLLSVAMAEEILRRNATPEDHERIVQEYIDKVVLKQ